MNDDAAFLEAHFYSGGLRHHTYASGVRPAWAPAADIVGFRDEFALQQDDAAIEFRRFKFGDSLVSWVGVFYKSVDAKFGDRGNHAGIGAWFRDVVPFDFGGLLAGLELLAQSISKDMNPDALTADAATFRSERFLPTYSIGQAVQPSPGFSFGGDGIVDSKIFHVLCDGRPSECCSLTDFLLRTSILQRETLPPRLIIHATRDRVVSHPGSSEIAPCGATAAALVRQMPELLGEQRDRAVRAENEVADLRLRLGRIEDEHGRLKIESAELEQLRDDPMRQISTRLDRIDDNVRSLLSDRRLPPAYIPAPHTSWTSPIGPTKRPVANIPRGEVQQGVESSNFVPIVLWIFIISGAIMLLLLGWHFWPFGTGRAG